MPYAPPAAAARRPLLQAAAALALAAAAACSGKSDAPAAGAEGTAGAAGAPAAAAPGVPNADSASSNVVTQSAPPTPQDRRVAVPDSAQAQPGDTNHSGMAVSGRDSSRARNDRGPSAPTGGAKGTP
jgi:hypothetical protein